MGKTTQVRIDESLLDIFGRIGEDFAKKIKKEYDLEELFVPHSLSSQILAAKYRGQKVIGFSIKKINSKKGTLIID